MKEINLPFHAAINFLKTQGGLIGNAQYPNIKLFLQEGMLVSDNVFNFKELIFNEKNIIYSNEWYWESEPEEKEYVLKKSELNTIIEAATVGLSKKDKDQVADVIKEEAKKFKEKKRGDL